MGRAERELEDASEHVKYEVDMLRGTTAFLASSAGATEQVTRNAYNESFVLHLRNLIDFFYKRQGPEDDILAEHYVSDAARWVHDRGPRTPFLAGEKGRASKRVEHLSFERLLTDEEGWRWADIRAQLQRVMKCFLSNLPPKRKPWFAGTGLEGPSGLSGTSSPPVDGGWTGPPEPRDPEKAKSSE
jgi:hypothetical protein